MFAWSAWRGLALFPLVWVSTVSAADLAIVGTGDGAEILQAVAAAFNADHEGTKAVVPPSIGSGGAVAAVGAGRQELGRVARPLTEQEVAQGLVATPLVRIPSAIFAHPDAGVRSLTSDQLAGIFAGRVENWREVGGPDLKIRVVRREDTDSTLSVLRATMPGWKELVLTARSKTATTTQDAVETVKRAPGAIAFGPYSSATGSGTVVLAIDGLQPLDETYPSYVTLALIHKPGGLSEAGQAFLSFALSAKARRLLAQGGGIPLTR